MAYVVSRENVCSVKTFTDKQTGEKKNSYRIIGQIATWDDGSKTLELNMIPNEKYRIFPADQAK